MHDNIMLNLIHGKSKKLTHYNVKKVYPTFIVYIYEIIENQSYELGLFS